MRRDRYHRNPANMADAEIEQKREEDERLDTAEDHNEEVRCLFHALHSRTKKAGL
jgi:hypothetical protein